MTNEIALYCMKAYSEYYSEVCEECPIYGETGTDHCFEDALGMAIKALETIPKYKDAYNRGWDDGAKATYEHLKMCEEEQEPKTDVLDKIRAEIEQLTSRYSISKERGGMGQVEWSDRLIKESDVLQIIDKYRESEVNT